MNENIQKILEENSVDKISFYFINSPIVNNAFTTCVLINTFERRIEARGVAICSILDTFCKSEGKNKAFGRAIKALLRKRNNWKIKGSARDDEIIKRSFKAKTENDEKHFREYIAQELTRINPNTPVTVSSNGKGKKFTYEIPMSYPVRLANSLYRYKSQYRPTPVGEEELDIFKKLDAQDDF